MVGLLLRYPVCCNRASNQMEHRHLCQTSAATISHTHLSSPRCAIATAKLQSVVESQGTDPKKKKCPQPIRKGVTGALSACPENIIYHKSFTQKKLRYSTSPAKPAVLQPHGGACQAYDYQPNLPRLSAEAAAAAAGRKQPLDRSTQFEGKRSDAPHPSLNADGANSRQRQLPLLNPRPEGLLNSKSFIVAKNANFSPAIACSESERAALV